MYEKTDLAIAIVIVICTILATLAVSLPWVQTDYAWREEAVDKGYAEYYLDDKHQVQWRWLSKEPADDNAKPHRI